MAIRDPTENFHVVVSSKALNLTSEIPHIPRNMIFLDKITASFVILPKDQYFGFFS